MLYYDENETKNQDTLQQKLGVTKNEESTTAERTKKVTLELKGSFGYNPNSNNGAKDKSIAGDIAKKLMKEFKND